jgi:uncharacterized membrane protein (GlpM family)
MILDLVVKMALTAVVVIVVTLMVASLGPRVGGIVAGMPITIGPTFYFLGREQSNAFVTYAAISTLHALASSLLFLICFVSVAARLSAGASVATAVATWTVAAAVFTQMPAGLLPALALYAVIFAISLAINRRLGLAQPATTTSVRLHDLIIRGVMAGVLVGIATTVGTQVGPALSGTLAGFPVGFLMISLTLHQRFGAAVARATLVAAQRGMLSLVAFATVTAALSPLLGGIGAFVPALAASLLASALMVGLAWRTIPWSARR